MDDKIKKIFDSIDRISKKLDYIAKSLEVFDPPRVYNVVKEERQK